MKDFISVIIPTFNSGHLIERAINSALSQEDLECEIIVIDDGSTDNTASRLAAYGDRIHYFHQQNLGAPAARNNGLIRANGEMVMFLDADDWLSPWCLSPLARTLREKGAQVVLGRVIDRSDQTFEVMRPSPRVVNSQLVIADWLNGAFIPPCGILWTTAAVRNLGGWDESVKKNQDGDLLYRAVLKRYCFAKSNHSLSYYYHHTSVPRISTELSDRKLLDVAHTIMRLDAGLRDQSRMDKETESALSMTTHRLERVACKNDLKESLNVLTQYRKQRKWPRYAGSIPHVSMSILLGLKRKEDMTSWLKSIFPAWW